MNSAMLHATTAMSMPDRCMAVWPMDAMALSMGPMTMGPLPMNVQSMPAMGNQSMSIDQGQDRLPWGDALWHRIDRSVEAESMRTRPASAFLPRVDATQGALTIDSDKTLIDTPPIVDQRSRDVSPDRTLGGVRADAAAGGTGNGVNDRLHAGQARYEYPHAGHRSCDLPGQYSRGPS